MTNVAEILGGPEVFRGHEIRSDLDLVRAAQRGFPITSIDALVRNGVVAADEVAHLVIDDSVLLERRAHNESLTPAESDHLARLARIYRIALATFGENEKAGRWLRKPNRGLGGAVPLELLATGEGGRIVEDALGQITHGIFA